MQNPTANPERELDIADAEGASHIERPDDFLNDRSTALAWEQALTSLKKSLPPKDLKRLQLPVRPEDLVHQVESWLASKPGKTRKAISGMGETVLRVQRFSGCIDQLAQGSPAPANLLWGSIKFVLTVIQDVSEEYDKICGALSMIFDSLPRVYIYADAFSQSFLVQQGLRDFFASVLHFWVKACKFYRRRAIWNFMRSTWNNFNSEFSKLEASTTSAVARIEKGALAEHIKDSKIFMSDQRQRNDVQDTKSDEESDLSRMFAPLLSSNEDMNYYVRDQETARRNRHPRTCEWILRHPQFLEWSKIPAARGGRFWITAGPGVGKTVLTSFIVDHFLDSGNRYEQPVLLYFYFKESNLHNNNATAAVCSIAYQLHRQQGKSRPDFETNAKAIFGRAGRAGDERKPAFPELWRLLDLVTKEKITLLLTSRRQKNVVKYLDDVENLEVTRGNVHQDIKAFVEFKVGRNPRLSHPLVRDTVIGTVLDQHDGMFLWVRLMLKELKACISMEQVQMTLGQVPSGLEGIYIKIVTRLEQTLKRRAAEMTKNILSWVLGSARNLTIYELREALACQYQAQGHTLLSDGEFPYADRDIEDMCGSLITIRHGQIQTVHQSTKEYLVGLGECWQVSQGIVILPTSVEQQLASVCLTYQEKLCASSLAKLRITPFDHHPDGFDVRLLREEKKLLDYSFFFWIHHVLVCPISHRESMVAIMLKHFSNFMTVSWIVVSMLLDSTGLWRLLIGVEEVEEWLIANNPQENMSEVAWCLQHWCSGVAKLLKAYSTLLLENPWNIWRLDLNSFLDTEQRFSGPSSRFAIRTETEESLKSSTAQASSSQKPPIVPKLGHNQDEWSLLKAELGFFVHDPSQNIFRSGEKRTTEVGECLFVQHAESGERLSPATAGLAAVFVDEEYHEGYVVTAKISARGKYLAVAYHEWLSIWAIKPNLKFSHRLRNRAWASRVISEKYRGEQREPMTAGVIAFAGDDKLYVPRGWYDLAKKEFHAFQSVLSDQRTEAYDIFYCGNCSHLFAIRQSESSANVIRQSITPVGLADSVSFELDLHSTRDIKPSNTGNYLLLCDFEAPYWYWDDRHKPFKMTLFNMALMQTEPFPAPEEFSSFGEYSFHFSQGDETLVTFLWEPNTRKDVHATMTVTVWELGSGPPKRCSEGKINTVVAAHPGTSTNPPIITITAQDFAWIVSCDRSIQIVRYTSEGVSFPGYNLVGAESSVLHAQISQDGYRHGTVRIVDSKIHLEVINLLPSLQEGFKLEKAFPDIEQFHPICLSPNLDLLMLGRFAWTFDTETNQLLPPIECDIDVSTFVSTPVSTPARDWDWACTISSCSEFVAFNKPAYKQLLKSHVRRSGRSEIFRINRRERTATRVSMSYPKDVHVASPDFHPFLPQAAISASKGEGSDNNQTPLRDPYNPAKELILSTMHLKEDELVPLEPLQMTHLVRSKLCFADTGDFLVLEGFSNHWTEILGSRIIVSDVPCQSRPLSVISSYEYIHPSKDRSYLLHRKSNSIMVTMYKFQSLEKESDLPAYQAVESTAIVEGLTVLPWTKGRWPDIWLLLGDDYSKPLRLLVQPSNGEPLVMKTLLVSWDELRERLETTLRPVEGSEQCT